MKFEFGPGFTYLQAYMMMKDFYVNSLLKEGIMFKGQASPKNEELSPLAENFIIEKCLSKIDQRLHEHVENTRGHLFSELRPTLACNQQILFSQIDVMLAELDGKNSTPSINNIRNSRPNSRPPYYPRYQNAFTRPTYPRQNFRFQFRMHQMCGSWSV